MREKKIFVVTFSRSDYLEFVSDFMLDKQVWKFCNSPKALYGHMGYDLITIDGWKMIELPRYREIIMQYKINGKRHVPEPEPEMLKTTITDPEGGKHVVNHRRGDDGYLDLLHDLEPEPHKNFFPIVETLGRIIRNSMREAAREILEEADDMNHVLDAAKYQAGGSGPNESKEIKGDRKRSGPVVVDTQCEMPVKYLEEILVNRYKAGHKRGTKGLPIDEFTICDNVMDFKHTMDVSEEGGA